MEPIVKKKVEEALQAFHGCRTYVHAEVIPGGFVRNAAVDVRQAHIAGDGPYRIAVQFDHDGWIRMENLTHFEIDGKRRLLLAGHDDQGRLSTVLELSFAPFVFGEGA